MVNRSAPTAPPTAPPFMPRAPMRCRRPAMHWAVDSMRGLAGPRSGAGSNNCEKGIPKWGHGEREGGHHHSSNYMDHNYRGHHFSNKTSRGCRRQCMCTCLLNTSLQILIHTSIHILMRMSIHMSVHMLIHTSMHMSTHMSIHMSANACLCRYGSLSRRDSLIEIATP